MLFTNNVIYGEKSGYIVQCDNNEKDFFTNYIKQIEESFVPQFNYENILHNLNRSMPSSGGINLSDACQLRCNYCSFSSDEGKKNTLKIDEAKAYVDFLFRNANIKDLTCGIKPFVRISFAGGGEPTFKWDILKEITQYAKHKSLDKHIKVQLSITTNGILDEEKIAYLSKTFDSIMVSYDGIASVQNENRLGTKRIFTNEIVEHTIEALLNQEANVIIRTTVWPHQYQMLRYMRDNIFNNYNKIKSWEINPVNYVGRAKNNIKTDNPTLNFYKYYYDLKQTSPYEISKRISSAWFSRYSFFYVCGTAFGSYPWLNSDGRIISCLDARDCGESLGKISEGKIYFNEYSDNMSVKHIRSLEKRCYDCIAFIHCGGGCPLKNKEARCLSDEEVYYSDIECENKKQYWKMVIENSMNGLVLNDMDLKVVDCINDKNIFKLFAKGE